MTIVECGAALRARKVSSVELVQEALSKAEHTNSRLNAFVTITTDAARQRAAALDEELARGIDRGPLHGVPIAHKDCLFTKGVRTTWGSKLFEQFVPDRDALAVTRLEDAGAVSIGKTGLHELTYGMTSNNPWFGAVRNPVDNSRVPGGSSGGSAAAVAAEIVPVATGTDTGGSIRIPASFCGVVGFKPTFDAVSRKGCFPLGLTLDHIGPLAATVRDAEAVFRAMAGLPAASESSPASLAGVRFGLAMSFFARIAPEVRKAVIGVTQIAEIHGARVMETARPEVGVLNTIGRVVQLAEVASVLRPYVHRRSEFGEDVLALIDQGRLIPATDYVNAQRARTQLAEESARVWEDADFLIAPTTPMTAPSIGENTVAFDDGPEDVRIAGTRLTRPFNVLGWPVLTMPCGFDTRGLPIGFQLIGRPGADLEVLAIGAALEAVA